MMNRTLPLQDAERGGSAISGVSWGAIIAGAFAAAALSAILVILGTGLGFSSVSPWSGDGLSAETISYSTIGWITFTQIAASAIGGYMAGRLRVKWADVQTDEIYFRDTAHGFLAWAVASLATAMLLSSAVGSMMSGGAKVIGSAGAAVAATGAAGGAMMASGENGGSETMKEMSGYFIDSLFRPMPAGSANNGFSDSAPSEGTRDLSLTPAQRAEVMRIFANALRIGSLPDADKNYMMQLLATRTGVSRADAEKRVNDTYAAFKKNLDEASMKARQAADTARKAAAYGSMWMFVALLCGAFIASFCAIYGGRQRDHIAVAESESRAAGSAKSVTAS